MYLALYRKYRPRTFDDVISQEHITTTLKNQIINDSAAHAYLFTGSRGTGKTTCAKILAMAVNCLNPKDGSPCLECDRCREILNETTTDIIEMDAASNNGVGDMRQLCDEIEYTPVSCKYRVYIIDEVHMLSPEAFNALLKTLEEPPPHVKFIMATTEVHKVPATISSRCQRFEFRRVDIADSAERLLSVAEKEGISLERGAAELISRLSDGGMRDALSILDRCISADTHITSETVRACAGVSDRKHLFAFSAMIAQKDTAGCIRLLGELYKGSKDVALIMDELSGQFRDLMLYKTAPNDKELLGALPDEYAEVERIAEMYSLEEILRCLTLLQQCSEGIGKVKQRKTLAEMCFVKMCTGAETAAAKASAAASKPVFEIKEKPKEKPRPVEELSHTERKTRELLEETAKLVDKPAAPEPPPFGDEDAPPIAGDEYPIPSPEPVPKAPEKETVQEPKAPEPVREVSPEEWENAVAGIREADFAVASMLGSSTVRTEGGRLIIRSSNAMLLNHAKGDELTRIEGLISDALGFPVHAAIEAAVQEEAPRELSDMEKFLDKARRLGIEVNIKNE
ncbi:MAG: DNA polymerase III subunit gamma/tau [Lachnospiraceae bacterium]|nr:DNA polymerase III subunit gamma/tau [Ruminococcus sp.]MCM1274472.1 DNA polymerase III subunit gamma/tau [Lachnospiraceae bacterium]